MNERARNNTMPFLPAPKTNRPRAAADDANTGRTPANAAPVASAVDNARARFMRLAHRTETDLLRLTRRLCRGGEDCAQDVAQDALVRAYEAFLNGQFRPQADNKSTALGGGDASETEFRGFRAWLLRIASNGFINDYRRRKKWDADVSVDTLTAGGEVGPQSTRAAAADTPGATLLTDTLDEPLERALRQLPDAMRLCVLLVDVEGQDYAQAAQTLGVPVGTVRSRLSRARYMLHDLLQDYAKERRLI